MTFPIVVKTRVTVEPAGSIHYLVADNGKFQIRDTPLHRSVTRVETVPELLPEYEHLRLKLPRIPRARIEEVIALFEEVYRRWKGEAMVFLFYSPATREYRIGVPPQTMPGRRRLDGRWIADLAIRYGSLDRPPGFLFAGDIHSHAELPAGASGRDCDDEQYEDALHVVVGSLEDREVSLSASFVSGGVRFPLVPSQVLEPFRRTARPARADWIARVRPEREADEPLVVRPGKEDDHVNAKASRRIGD
jgi:hypothetical protein